MRWQLTVGVLAVLAGYVMIGGLIFWYLEEIKDRRDDERRTDSSSSSLKSPFDRQLALVTMQTELISHLLQQLNTTAVRGRNSWVLSNKCIAVRKVATPLRELTCHMGSHSVTCHPAEVTFPPLPQPKLVLD